MYHVVSKQAVTEALQREFKQSFVVGDHVSHPREYEAFKAREAACGRYWMQEESEVQNG